MVSWVWNHFDKFGEVAKCQLCSKIIKCRGGSTSGLVRHLKYIHNLNAERKFESSYEYLLKTEEKRDREKAEELEKLIVEMVAEKSLPLDIVECQPFINFIKVLDPNYKLPTLQTLRLKLTQYHDIHNKTIPSKQLLAK